MINIKKINILPLIFLIIGCNNKTNHFPIDQLKVKELADKVSEWQLINFNYVEDGNLHDYGIDSWTNAVFYLGLSRWASISEYGEEYYNWLYTNIGEEAGWQIANKFVDNPIYGLYHADELCMGQFYFEMYNKYQQPKIIINTIERLDQIIVSPPDSSLSYRNKKTWSWCDALFMAPPVYLEAALVKNDSVYLNFMHHNFLSTYYHLYDTKENLFYRDDSYIDKREANGEKVFWGRGNGWVLAGIANILRLLPENDYRYSFYVELFQSLATRIVQLQHLDGFWHASLLDPQSYPNPETSATSLIAYSLAFGINNGLLTDELYTDSLSKAWNSLLLSVDENGKLGWVQPIGADPKNVTSEMTSVYGVGSFLLAAAELLKCDLL